MSERKHLILRTVQTFSNSMHGSDAGNGYFTYQILLDPMNSPDIAKVFQSYNLGGKAISYFKYDYVRIKNVVIVIRPILGIPTDNIVSATSPVAQQQPSTPIYGYYTLKLPICLNADEKNKVSEAYGITPDGTRIKIEGKHKSTFSFPSGKSISLVLNSLKSRTNAAPCVILNRKLYDMQNLATNLSYGNQIYNPFDLDHIGYQLEQESLEDSKSEEMLKNKNDNSEDFNQFNAEAQTGVTVDAVDEKSYNYFFGRVVLVAQKPYQFTVEVLYDCDFYR